MKKGGKRRSCLFKGTPPETCRILRQREQSTEKGKEIQYGPKLFLRYDPGQVRTKIHT